VIDKHLIIARCKAALKATGLILAVPLATLVLGFTVGKAQSTVYVLHDGEAIEIQCQCDAPTATPPTPTDTPIRPTPTPDPTDTPQPSPTNPPPTATATWTPVPPTSTLTPTATAEPIATVTQLPTPTDTPPPTATNTPEPTETPTETPTPTATPTTPPPTSTPLPSNVAHGVVRIDRADWPTVVNELNAGIVELLVRPSHSVATINSWLDEAEALDLRVLVHPYDSSQNTNAPWYLSGTAWQVTAWGDAILTGISDHPALWAFYTLHEPWSSSSYDCDADCQRAMYSFLKGYTDAPLYTDVSTLHMAEDAGEVLSDGMCDYCGVFPCRWPDVTETLNRLNADYDTQQRLMPNSQIVVGLNTYDLGTSYVIPTESQLQTVRARVCELGLTHLYYPWTHSGYTRELKDATELWDAIAEGCGSTPPTPQPTATPSATHTPPPPTPTEPPATPTDTPQPSPTPDPGSAIVIGYDEADPSALTQAQLDAARAQSYHFNHRSIGNNILDGMADLEAQDATRYSISIQYSAGTSAGINHYQAGANQQPYDKIDGFAANVRDGHDAAFMKFCVGDFVPWTSYPAGDIADAYLDMMAAQQAAHPDTVLVYWTSPLTTQSDARGLASFATFNAAVRAHVAANGGVLFDIADIESNGGACTAGGYEAMCNEYSDDGAHLTAAGGEYVAGALWVMLAEVAQ
jgi:hypothetical protein